MRIGINGLGRIGRLALRVAVEKGINIAAVNDRNDLAQLVPLIKRDSIYGSFSVGIDGDDLVVAGMAIPMFRNQPFPDWAALGADIVLECSGGNPEGNRAREHLRHGAKAVIISAPAPNVNVTLVMGINEIHYDPEKHKVISMASCTTNCVGQVLTLLAFVRKASLVSVNAYTNAQRIVDAPHADPRRARAAALNIIPTASSADGSMKELFPDLDFEAVAYRVPVACGSVANLCLELEKPTTEAEVKKRFLFSPWVELSMEPLVSSDVIGNPHSAIVDGLLLKVDGRYVRVVAWYDNEFGFASRLCDLAVYMSEHGLH